MGRISATTGLVSGIDTQSIITQLLEIEGRPISQLQDKIKASKGRQTALLDLSARLLSLQFSGAALGTSTVLNARSAASSNPTAVTALADTNAPLASYQVRPIRLAQTQQLISTGFADATTAPIGAGAVTFKLGGFVDQVTSLDQLNGGQGVTRGSIRITDRSGASAVVDLSASTTVSDVLSAINQTAGIRVRASVRGDSIVLADQTGQTSSNLVVQEVGAGSTATDLGLAASVAGDTLTGADVVELSGVLRLSYLNDGNGVRKSPSVNDFRITLKTGATLDVNLGSATNLQGVLDAINNHADNSGLVTASIDAGGDRLVLTDQSGGGGTLTVGALNGSQAAADLGLLGDEQAGGVLTGQRILSGLNTVLLKDVRGGAGIAVPGQVQLTDRSGATATIDLTAAETLDDVVSAINGAGLGLTAATNVAGNGLSITDTTGASVSNLIVADVGGGTTAENLGLVVDVAGKTKNGGDLNVRYLSENSRLDRLNAGAGIQRGRFKITDSAGGTATIDLTGTDKQTLGDLLVAINSSGAQVTARINDTGDGVLLTDTAGGTAPLTVTEVGGATAASLRLLGSSVGQIDGAFRYTVTVDASDTLQNLAEKLASSGAPLNASIVNDGSPAQPFRLLFTSNRPGAGGRLLIDTGDTGLNPSRLNDAADALLSVGNALGNSLLFTSATNAFSNALPGVTIAAVGVSATPVTVTIGQDSSALVDTLAQFVDNYNNVATALQKATSFDATTNQRGVLQADRTAEQVRDLLARLVTDLAGSPDNFIRSFSQLGVSLKDGQLTLDEDVLQSRIAADPAAVRDFLGAANTGASARLATLLKNLTQIGDGAIASRVETINGEVAALTDRTTFLNGRLENKRLRLQKQFLQMEQALARIQSQGNALTQLSQLAVSFASVNRTK